MNTHGSGVEPSFSARLVRPFVSLLLRYQQVPREMLAPLEALDADERLPVANVVELLRGAVLLTGDADLGLKAARELEVGDLGAIEYAAISAATVMHAQAALSRYCALLTDAMQLSLSIENGQAIVRFHNSVPWDRASNDFQVATFYGALMRHQKAVYIEPGGEVWLAHPEPADTREYAKSFPDRGVRFDAPCNGFITDAALFERRLGTGDSKLHELICKHADALLAAVPKYRDLRASVRALIMEQMSRAKPTPESVARKLGISARTLARRLEEEGTSFKELLDDAHKRIALRYVGEHEMDVEEISALLGFSEPAAFYRAFKRWTGETPLAYRRTRR